MFHHVQTLIVSHLVVLTKKANVLVYKQQKCFYKLVKFCGVCLQDKKFNEARHLERV
jgi:hypothetical protein